MNAVLVAAALDLALGEPPTRCHPVAWMGRYLERAGRRVPPGPPVRAVISGGLAWSLGMAGAAAAGLVADWVVIRLPGPMRAGATGVVLWTLCSGRLLFGEVAGVEHALGHGLQEGRRRLARLVSRDPTALSAEEVRASALESLAENLSDSVVAPLLWYAVGGLPAACAYRFANTADAMWGYRTTRWEHAGRVAARADDLLNLAPARLTALLLRRRGSATSWSRLAAEARRTPSPNGGWPMSALAFSLDLRLPKPGTYQLNDSGRAPRPEDTTAALQLAARAAALAVVLTASVEQITRAPRRHTDGARPRSSRHAPGSANGKSFTRVASEPYCASAPSTRPRWTWQMTSGIWRARSSSGQVRSA